MDPLISIIITCFNLGEYIDEAVSSALNQSYQNIEIIIVDDGSTDFRTVELLKSFSSEKIRVVFQQNSGVSLARNLGASLATGNYFLFLDGDDKLDLSYIEKVVKVLEKNGAFDYIYCDLKEFGQGCNVRKLDDLKLSDQLLYHIPHPSGVINRNLWNKSKGFDVDFIKGWEDWDFWIRVIALNIRYYKIAEPLFFYRIRDNSRDKVAIRDNQEELEQMIFSKNLSYYLKFYNKPISILREYEILKKENLRFEEVKREIYSSWSYRIGAFALKPLKFFAKKARFNV